MRGARRTLVLSSLIALGVAWTSPPAAAQDASDAVLSAVREMESAAGSEVAVRRSPLTGLATFVAVKRGQGIPIHDGTPEARALAFVEAYGNAFGLRDTSRELHNLSGIGSTLSGYRSRFEQIVANVDQRRSRAFGVEDLPKETVEQLKALGYVH